MPDDLEYVVNKAMTICDKGIGVMPFTSTANSSVKIQNELVGTELDFVPLTNIPSFGICSITKTPCSPIPTGWQDTYEFVKVKGFKPLVFKSCMQCGIGGKIEFITSGQIPLEKCVDENTYEAIQDANRASAEAVEEYELEKNSVGESGIAESFLPVWGSGRDAVHSFQTGHWKWGIFHSVMVGVDVLTLGVSSVVKGTVSGGLKAGAKAVGKSLSKKMVAALAAKDTAIALIKSGFKGLNKLTITHLSVCIAKACFPAGTPIATKNGLKNIEEIQIGDEVWAYDEYSRERDLKKVLNTFEKESHTIIELVIKGELLKTTPEHPFFVDGKWKEAGLLKVTDKIMLFSGELAEIEKIDHIIISNKESIGNNQGIKNYENHESDLSNEGIKVFNFEVEDWHTYFVGSTRVLVHNTDVCLKEIGTAIIKQFGINLPVTAKTLKQGIKGAGKDILEGIIKKVDNIAEHLSHKDITGAVRDILGNPVIINGKTYNHLGEVEDAMTGLSRQLQKLDDGIKTGKFNDEVLKEAERVRSALSQEKDRIANILTQAKNGK